MARLVRTAFHFPELAELAELVGLEVRTGLLEPPVAAGVALLLVTRQRMVEPVEPVELKDWVVMVVMVVMVALPTPQLV
jgi:hypothetical protein